MASSEELPKGEYVAVLTESLGAVAYIGRVVLTPGDGNVDEGERGVSQAFPPAGRPWTLRVPVERLRAFTPPEHPLLELVRLRWKHGEL